MYSVGGDSTAIVGADRYFIGEDAIIGQEPMAGMGMAEQAALARSAGGFIAKEKVPSPTAFYQMLPFSFDVPGTEGPGSNTVVVPLNPQRTFRVDNLIITSPEGPFFELSSWNVGQLPMFVADGSVNCAAFSEAAAQKGVGLRGFTANQGAQIVLRFTNLDTDTHRLSGMLSGPAMIAVG